MVDDEEPITRIQKRLLEQLNYKVTTFNDSLAALDHFKANPKEFSAVLTDMTMPHMTGAALIYAIQTIQPDIPAILCTGFSKYPTREALEKENIKYFCRKPVLNDDLARVIRAAIDGNAFDDIA